MIRKIAKWFLKIISVFVVSIIIIEIVKFDISVFDAELISILLVIILIIIILLFKNNFESVIIEYNYIFYGLIIGLMYKNNEFSLLLNKFRIEYLFNIKGIIGQFIQNINKYTFCIIILSIELFISLVINRLKKINNKKKDNKHKKESKDKNELIVERKKDIELLNSYMLDDNVYGIGIDGSYGSGKTFLINKFIDLYKGKYSFIRIFSISANDDNVEEYILNQLKSILLKNGVFSLGINDIVDDLDRIKFLKLFHEKETCYEKYRKVKHEVELIDKNVVFIIDDLDRVRIMDKIIKLFNIFEALRCSSIKCIYLYDIENLVKKFAHSLERKATVSNDKEIGEYTHYYNYVRKYIDREIVLSRVNDYANACCRISQNNDFAKMMFEEKDRINNEFRSITYDDNIFDYYCRFNPRVLNLLYLEYDNKIMEKSNDNEKRRVIRDLLFKYYFENNKNFTQFLLNYYDSTINGDAKAIYNEENKNKHQLFKNKLEHYKTYAKDKDGHYTKYDVYKDYEKRLKENLFLLIMFNL